MYAQCYLLQKQMCFICRDTAGCLHKSLFSQVKPPSLLTTLLLPVWAFWRLNLKWRFHTAAPQLFAQNMVSTRVIFEHWTQTDTLGDAGLEICHFKARVKWPLWLLIGLSPSITPVLCITPFIRPATATNTLNSSSFDPP